MRAAVEGGHYSICLSKKGDMPHFTEGSTIECCLTDSTGADLGKKIHLLNDPRHFIPSIDYEPPGSSFEEMHTVRITIPAAEYASLKKGKPVHYEKYGLGFDILTEKP